ncbi:MAG: ATPase,transcriptional regulator, luxR family, partial [Pseudonocardia sp.]|nr:ATPase,transcriptional regulator, luxR family [Pseudonocardia sp.]
RRLMGFPVGLLFSERVADGVSLPLAVERAVPGERFRRVVVGPLSLAALQLLFKQRLQRSFPRRLLVRIADAAGGNPFFALEIARSLPTDASPSLVRLPVPDRLLDLVEGRILALPGRSRLVLLAAAALRSPTQELVRTAGGGSAAESRRAFEHAESQGFLVVEGSQLRFGHPLFAAAVYASASAAERRRIHRKLAALVPEIEEQVRHLAFGADGADPDLARSLDAAAELARSRGAPESAAELSELARTLTPAEHVVDIQRRTIRVAEYRFHAGDIRPARELLEVTLRQGLAGRTRADALRLLGEIRYHEDSFPEAMSLLAEALDHVGDDPQVESAIQLRLALTFRAMGEFVRAEPHTRRALELAEAVGERGLLAEALAVAARLDFLLGHGLDEARLERALELEDPHRLVAMQLRPSKIAGDLLVYAGQLERAVQILERERQRVLERGEDSDLAFVQSHLVWAECWRGRLATASSYAEESLERALLVGGSSAQCLATVFAAVAAAHRGDASTARQWAEKGLALAAATGWDTPVVWAKWALGLLAVSMQDAPAVDAALGSLTAIVEQNGLTEPIRAMFLADEIEALIILGELDRAARLVDMLHEAGVRLKRSWVLVQAGRCRALLRAARGDVDRAAQAAYQALADGGDLELRLELGRTLLVAGQIERRRRRKHEARGLLEHAWEIFEDAGARMWAGRARAELDRATARPAGDALTTSEQRVAKLAAAGFTNREVAAQLFISHKTVEANLARAYRKLGIHSRAQLGARLGVAPQPRQT